MITRVRTGKDQPKRIDAREFRMAPIARAIAMTLAAGGVINVAQAQQAFSPAWFAAKGAVQQTAAQTGKLPNGMPVSSLHSPDGQRQRANEQLQRSINNLGLAAQAIAVQQRLQQQARDSARTQPGVPDGLADGGLKVDTNSLTAGWLNAKDPTQTVADGKTTVNIGQTADKAILNWETFNVGRNTTVNFDQATYDAAGNRTAQTNWAVLNKVNDPSARPSQIQGQIKADGTVMIVNRNGIVFSGSSQVNTRNLVAAAANISKDQFENRGLHGATATTASFTDAGGAVIVERGALIQTAEPKSVTDGGGYVMLLGKEVANAGEIITRKGQTLLAAGDSFIIRKGVGTDANQYATTRGSEIAPQFLADGVDGEGKPIPNPAGKVTNSGLILAREGDITLAGREVRQDGTAISTATVHTRGTIHLLSSANDARSTVTLGKDAVTAIVTEDDGTSTALDAQRDALIKESATLDAQRTANAATVGTSFDNYSALADRRDLSRIEIVGGSLVNFETGSLTLATGGQLAVASGNSYAGTKNTSLLHGSVRVNDGAVLDVSGSVGVQVAMESNNIKVNVQGNELRDSPLNRDTGKLFNKDIWLDRRNLMLVPAGTDGYESDRYYTAGGLLEVSGYLGNAGHSIGEWTAQGGRIHLASDNVVTQAGSLINLAGGTLDVATGYVNTSWLKGRDGRIYRASEAPADVLYSGVYTGYQLDHARWNVTESFYNPLIAPQRRLENGYTVGRDAGELLIWAPNAALAGDIDATVFNGVRQTASRPSVVTDGYKLSQTQAALAGRLSLRTYDPGAYDINPRIEWVPTVRLDGALPAEGDGHLVWLNLDRLNEAGLGGLSIVSRTDRATDISLAGDLTLAPGGVLNLQANAIELHGSLTARGGSVRIKGGASVSKEGIFIIPGLTLKGGIVIDTRGLWVNTAMEPDRAWALAFLNGGSIDIDLSMDRDIQAGDIVLEAGSRLDASAGGAVLADGSTRGGAGGDIRLSGGNFVLDGELASHGFTRGGKLSLKTLGNISIGGSLLRDSGKLGAGEEAPLDLILREGVWIQAGNQSPISFPGKIELNRIDPGQPLPGMYGDGTSAPNSDLFTPGSYGAYNPNDPASWSNYIETHGEWDLLALTQSSGQLVTVRAFDPANPAGTYGTYGAWGIGWTIPKGWLIEAITSLPARAVLPVGVFPEGIRLPKALVLDVTHPAGTLLTEDRYFEAGTHLPKGWVANRVVAVQPSLDLLNPTSFFQQGFSAYELTGVGGVIVQPGTRIDVTMPVQRLSGIDARARVGDALAGAAELMLPEDHFVADPVTGVMKQRAGADVSLSSGTRYKRLGGSLFSGALVVGQDAAITVDPGHRINLTGKGQITVDGTLSAPGGHIAVINTRTQNDLYIDQLNSGKSPNSIEDIDPTDALSVWIGSHAVLDVAGRAYTTFDVRGNPYGVVLDGGSVQLGGAGVAQLDSKNYWGLDSSLAYVVVRPGAQINASGTSAVLSVGEGSGRALREIASDGGDITISSMLGFHIDDAVNADGGRRPALRAEAGGSGASGGSLSLILESGVYANGLSPVAPDSRAGRALTVAQHYSSSGLAGGVTAGSLDEGLVIGQARISVDQVKDGGFDSLSLWGRTAIVFDGDVDLSLGRSLTLQQGYFHNTTEGGNVRLSAPYVLFDGGTRLLGQRPGSTPTLLETGTALPAYAIGGSFTVDASLIDLRNSVRVNFDQTKLQSTGDLRFLAATRPSPEASINPGPERITKLQTWGDLELAAAQVYPASGVLASVNAGIGNVPGIDKPSIISILATGDGATAQPYSMLGDLTLTADVIRQGGVLRAPFGTLTLNAEKKVELLAGSITGVGTRDLVMSYGGTVDGVKYTVDGADAATRSLISGQAAGALASDPGVGLTLNTPSLVAESGSKLDLSGGGELLGAAFVPGRGGSVDTLLHARNPGGKVYAIVTGAQPGAAPVAGNYYEAWTGAVPEIGQQITIPAGVPGLPAGTYTLMPANYALLPGAWRVELGGQTNTFPGALPQTDGSYVVSGRQSIANTDIRDAYDSHVTLTSGASLRTYSSYNETGYSQFQRTQAQTFGTLRPLLEGDGKWLTFNARIIPDSAANSALSFDGLADFSAGRGGLVGGFALSGPDNAHLIITGAGSVAQNDAGTITVAAAELEKLGSPNLALGGRLLQTLDSVGINMGSLEDSTRGKVRNLTLERGATLTGGQIILGAGDKITLEEGATLNTVGHGLTWLDQSSGLRFGPTANPQSPGSSALLVVSNGLFTLSSPSGRATSSIELRDGVTLYSEGTVGFYADRGVSFSGTPNIGTRNLSLAVPSFNIGTEEALAAVGALPAGMNLNQAVLDRLFAGNLAAGVPSIEKLVLTANKSINFFGSIDLDTIDPTTGKSRLNQFVFDSPAIYGYGSSGDLVRLTTDTLVWNNTGKVIASQASGQTPIYESSAPGATMAGGTGSGRFQVDANTVVFGNPTPSQPDLSTSFNRLMLGFADVELNAAERITGNAKGSISVYQSGADPSTGFNPDTYVGTGGNLHLSTPLLTGAPGSVIAYHAGGALNVAAPAGSTAPATTNDVGAQLDLHGGSIHIASAVVLPSGKLTLTADGDVTLADGALLDVSGRRLHFFDVTRDTWGGDIEITSEHGNVVQQAGATIDVSAANEDAGSLSLAALDASTGRIALNGTLRGSGASGHDQGRFMLGAQRIGDSAATLSADFAALNTVLTDAGFIGARGFAFKQGDLIIGNEMKAREVTVSVDGGSLTVNGRIDATGAKPGTIRLAARDDLRLGGSAELDARGTQLQVDSYGQAIEAKNRGTIELTSSQGWLRLDDGTTLDVSAPGVEYGRITLNARRANETGGDILVDASGRVNVRGARSIAVNGFWTYSPTDADGTIVQDNTADGVAAGAVGLDQIDVQNQAFYANALAHGALQARLEGLKAYGDAYHLRPGVEIISSEASNGKLTVKGDLNLAGYRYGPDAVRNPNAADYGAGEPLALTVRAAGDLDINGSITDGFGLAKEAPDGVRPGELIPEGTISDADWWLQSNMTILSDWTVPETEFYQSQQGYIYDTNWNYYGPGMVIPAGTALMGDGYSTVFQAGQPLPSYQAETTRNLPVRHWAVAPMLAAGSYSASLRLIGGADLTAADTRALQSAVTLAGRGNMTLDDHHVGSSGLPIFSVLRTGTGNLDLLAGGDFSQKSLFGIYTAGTQSNLATGNEAFNLPRAKLTGDTGYDAALNDQATWFPDHGGDLYVAAQGNLSAYQWSNYSMNSNNVASWLWRQGGDGMGQQTAWSVNFGTYVSTEMGIGVVGFTGFGALGGGNLTLLAGGDAGRLSPFNLVVDTGSSEQANTALVAAIGASGRVARVTTTVDGVVTGGTLVQTGGGDLTVRIGGSLDPARFGETSRGVSAGTFTNLRGDLDISAGAIGVVEPGYGRKDAKDPRGADLWTAGQAYPNPGFTVVPGDGTVRLRARGDLVLGGVGDATMLQEDPFSASNYSKLGTLISDGRSGIGRSWFSLWSPETKVSLFSLGGNVTPFTGDAINTATLGEAGSTRYLPASLTAVAANGSLYYGDSRINNYVTFELLPAPQGQLEFLAKGSIYSMRSQYGGFSTVSLSGARAGINDLPNPFKPAWILTGPDADDLSLTNILIDGNPTGGLGTNTLLDITLPAFEGGLPTLKPRLNYFAFQTSDTPQTLLHAGDAEPIRVYAIDGDIVGMSLGSATKVAKAAQVRAGRDIVRFDGVIMNANDTDVSVVEAARDVMFANVRVAGPGTLEVNTGRNLYQGDAGQLVSVGAIVPGDSRSGASIAVQVGATDVDWAALASLYLDPANQADLTPGNPLAEQPGKVAHTYEEELATWLSERYGFTGTSEETLAHFNTLPAEQQRIFLRTVYYAELREGGREYTDVDGPRFGSYLRGRQVIATLFPEKDAEDVTIERSGTYTAFGGSGIQTQFGGDIQMLVPAGQIILGVQGTPPPATSGLITQGQGDIQLYSQDSILLGLSRIMTTFGGSILGWSAKGDINAGRGSKTTLVYTPPKLAYDQWGNVALSPQVPSSGAGIATLNPIPEVPPGDVDLIAPLGIIDAGEAGIRFSGNANFAALQVVNAENIVGQGEATGLPVVAAVNVAALTNASAAASTAATAAQDAMQRERASARQALPSIFTVRVLGFGNERLEPEESEKPSSSKQPGASLQSDDERYDPSRPVKIVGLAERIDPKYWARLTDAERQSLRQDR
ncbi:filamentous haemagglutinin family protein [Variovorax sp.]|jgi:filamentous hemagglutinin family protein|uniref:filamentous haemagglutinin family protein n=1 Tax=Variovorax sp. TaxID=1871043 RepID=UPI001ACFCED9|nr:filamentous hemagglutinin family protein [Burkholderiales bacterium]